MAKHGRLGEFDNTIEDWDSYIERLKYYFTANDVTAPVKQRAVLLSVCGASTYRLVKNVLAPESPNSVDFDKIVTEMKAHFQPAPSETVQRCLFNSRTRRPGESIATYMTELKKLSEHCNFGDKLDEMLRDRLVCGIGDERWQRRLLAEEGLTYKDALKHALALETAEKQVKDIQGVKPVHQVREAKDPRSRREPTCTPQRSAPLWRKPRPDNLPI